jgi:hypothetical protein
MANALWLAVDADSNLADSIETSEPFFAVFENMFCAFFTFEIIARFCAFKVKRNALHDNWFRFDSFLAIIMTVETWFWPLYVVTYGTASQISPPPQGQDSTWTGQLNLLKMLRLLRLARISRVIVAFPVLVTLVHAMVAAIRSVGSTIMLLIIFMYIFAIFFMQQLKETMPDEFGTLQTAMKTLFVCGCILDEVGTLAKDLQKNSQYMFFVLVFYILLTAFTVMNMLIGVLCEVISAVSAAQKDKIAIEFVKCTIAKVLWEMDKDGDGFIAQDEFLQLAADEQVRGALDALDVDVDNFVSLSDYLFHNPETGKNDKRYSHQEFLTMVVSMRSTNTARVVDIVSLRKLITKCFSDQKDVMINEKTLDDSEIEKIKDAVEKFVARLTKKVDDALQRLDHRVTMMEGKQKTS